jgi:hypothetical protein
MVVKELCNRVERFPHKRIELDAAIEHIESDAVRTRLMTLFEISTGPQHSRALPESSEPPTSESEK